MKPPNENFTAVLMCCRNCSYRTAEGVCRFLTKMVRTEFSSEVDCDECAVVVSVETPDEFVCGAWKSE